MWLSRGDLVLMLTLLCELSSPQIIKPSDLYRNHLTRIIKNRSIRAGYVELVEFYLA